MKIHSSSLRFISTNEINSENNTQPLNELKKSPFVSPTEVALVLSERTRLTNKEIGKIQNLTTEIETQNIPLSDSRASQAISHYTQENTQLLQKQRADLISRIDFFI